MKQDIIYVYLLDEGVDSWRPIKAEFISENKYKIIVQEIPSDEIWEFQPESIVKCMTKEKDGESILIATEIIS